MQDVQLLSIYSTPGCVFFLQSVAKLGKAVNTGCVQKHKVVVACLYVAPTMIHLRRTERAQ